MKLIFKVIAVVLFTNISYGHNGINTTNAKSDSILYISTNNDGDFFPIDTLINTSAITENKKTAFALDNYYWDTTNGKSKRFFRGEQGNQYVGELFGGGILFHIYENKGGSKGLIS